jgi:hypothetical protein
LEEVEDNAEAARELRQKTPDISQCISGFDLEKYLRRFRAE